MRTVQAWFADNASWLEPYAAYSWLRQLFGTAEHWRWGAMSKPSPELLERITGPGGQLALKASTCQWSVAVAAEMLNQPAFTCRH